MFGGTFSPRPNLGATSTVAAHFMGRSSAAFPSYVPTGPYNPRLTLLVFPAGARLGSYEIVSALGAGGMGEVYRATDTKLKRHVAVKILSPSLAADTDRIVRFQREAEVLASLNHPNIATIYGLEDAGPAKALVMELVEGEDLSQRLARGAIPVEEALPMAKQIAEALEAAHDKGIVHRDLKPANIKIRTDGTVKVLDFGLARLDADSVGPGAAHALSLSATASIHATQAGVILGTASYMSPEQARGRPVDRRTDIWAFGCVVFEMLTGRPPFASGALTDVLSAITRDEPDWSALPAETPLHIRTLLRRCLQKDPQKRLPHVGVARIEIEEGDISAPLHLSGATQSVAAAWIVAALLGVTLAVVLILWPPWQPRSSAPGSVVRFPVVLPPSARLMIGANQNQRAVAMSPDGRRLVYAAGAGSSGQQLYLRAVDQLESVVVRGTEGATSPFFSPDGQWIAFSTPGKLKKVPAAGGAAVTICEKSADHGATWLTDDTIVFANSEGAAGNLMRVSAAGGLPTEFAGRDPQNETALRWPEMLPGGTAMLVTIQRRASDFNGAAIAVMQLDTRQRRIVVEGGTSAHYVPSGHLVFARSGSVLALPFDLRTLQVTGVPIPVIDDVFMSAANGTVHLAVSQTGSMVYMAGKVALGTPVWVDRQGLVTATGAPPQRYEFPRLSPDTHKMAVTINGGSAGDLRDVWIYDFVRGNLSRLTSAEGGAETPVWTPDGERVTYATGNDPSERQFVSKSADSSGVEEKLGGNNRHLHIGSWSPAGDMLVSVESASGAEPFTFWLLNLKPTPSFRPLMKTSAVLQAPAISPDGGWLAYAANDTGRFEVYVEAFPGPGGKYKISTNGGAEPRWTRNGSELVYRNGDKMMAVSIQNNRNGLEAGSPAMLFEGYYSASTGTQRDAWYDVSADGRRFLMLQPVEVQNANSMVVVHDWASELKARVPTK